jgi:hypothetical protein
MTTTLAIYVGIYLYNIADILFFTDRREVLGANPFERLFMAKSKENGFDFNMARVPAGVGSSASAVEQKYIFSYSYHW